MGLKVGGNGLGLRGLRFSWTVWLCSQDLPQLIQGTFGLEAATGRARLLGWT